jgi:hypothetical protein
VRSALAKHEKGAKSPQRAADTAAVLACFFRARRTFTNVHETEKEEATEEWYSISRYCQAEIPVGRAIEFGRDELTHFYYAQAVYALDGIARFSRVAWSDYRKAMFDQLQTSQNGDGGWPAGNGLSVGRVYSTALCCIILQLDRGHYPSFPRKQIDQEIAAGCQPERRRTFSPTGDFT